MPLVRDCLGLSERERRRDQNCGGNLYNAANVSIPAAVAVSGLVKKLMDVVVVSQEIRRDFSRPFELPVLSDNGLELFDLAFDRRALCPTYW
jgi:hypothetical protein